MNISLMQLLLILPYFLMLFLLCLFLLALKMILDFLYESKYKYVFFFYYYYKKKVLILFFIFIYYYYFIKKNNIIIRFIKNTYAIYFLGKHYLLILD